MDRVTMRKIREVLRPKLDCGRPAPRDPKDRALVLERYSQLKEDPIYIIVLDVQRVKRRAERATGLANGKSTRSGVVTSRR